jgi:pyruvate/2-oxoacid:ferredoxin oxidoreductase alpha subunit
MISIVNTPNFTGVTIRGDYYDLYNLVQALYEIAISEFSEKHQEYIDMSLRVLSVCYDIRHAFMAHRDIYLVDNNMTEEKMKWHSLIVPEPTRSRVESMPCPALLIAIAGISISSATDSTR